MAQPSLLARTLVGYGVYVPSHPRKWMIHGWLMKLLRVKVDGELEVVRAGSRWALTPSDYCQASLYWLGHKDQWEIHNLLRILPPESVILDVGANFGYYSIRLAAGLGPKCRIIAIEPCPANFARLQRNVALNSMNDMIEMHRVGVSDQPGSAFLDEDRINSGHAVLNRSEGIEIKLTTIDEICASQNLDRLDALIVDVEGYEPHALKGAVKTIARFKPLVFVELWPPVMSRQGTTVQEVADLFEAQGYKLFQVQRARLVPLEELPEGDVGINAFAFHRDRIPAGL